MKNDYSRAIKKSFLLLSIILLLSLGVFEKRVSDGLNTDEIITQSLYDEWYFQQPTWAITQFPKNRKDFSSESYAWGWSYVANSLIDMYKATGDEKYLEFFIPQAEHIITQTDEKLGIESFTNSGLSLPAWSDRGHYTSGKFTYTYPVHTGMITLPILRFVDVVKEKNLSKYRAIADRFLLASGEALAIHNKKNMWRNFSDTEGFYRGHSYGEDYVSEANKIGVPNRVFAYLAACGLYDKLTGGEVYTQRIEKSLRYFKNSLIHYDMNFDSYYWSYYAAGKYPSGWEDISHAALTVYGLFILHEEAGFKVLTDKDFIKFKNIVYKMVKDDAPTKVRKYIHKRKNEKEIYYNEEENAYYYSVLRWAFLGIYDKKMLDRLEGVYQELYLRENSSNIGLFSIAAYLNTKSKLED